MTAPILDPDPLDPTPTEPAMPPRMLRLIQIRDSGRHSALADLVTLAAHGVQFARWAAKSVNQLQGYLPKVKAALVGLDTARKAHAARLTTLEARVTTLEAKTP